MKKVCPYCKENIEEGELKANSQQYHIKCFQYVRKEYLKKWRLENKEKQKRYMHKWISKHKRKNIENCKKFRKNHREKYLELHRLNQREQRKRHPDRIRARNVANRFLKHLKKEGFEFHHPDYSKPLQIEIIPIEEHYKIHNKSKIKYL